MNDKRAYWMKHYQDYQSSGLSVPKWCKKNDIPANTLRYWIKKFDNNENESKQTKWATVIPALENEIKETKPLKVTIGNAIIEVVSGFDHDTLKILIGILKEQC